eukprot:GHVP01029033.1.p1 GENE.GHVP01029033.1~~GHVP01029033.1.p1  ORF type:complete len:275 (+),score=74.02 GHVP01029033.1:810-1634(+)
MKKFPSSVDPNFPSASKSSFEPSKENKDSMKEPWKFATPRTPPPPPVAGFEKHAAEQIQEDLEEVPHSNVKIVPWPELPAIAFEAALDPIAANSNALDLAENEEKKKNASPMKPLYDPEKLATRRKSQQFTENFSNSDDESDNDELAVRLKEAEARDLGIKSPWRSVRSRFYVASASHLQSFLNIFLDLNETSHRAESHIDQDSIRRLASCEINYLSHIVFRVFENLKAPKDHPKKFTVEVLFSPGAKHNLDSRHKNFFIKCTASKLLNTIKCI